MAHLFEHVQLYHVDHHCKYGKIILVYISGNLEARNKNADAANTIVRNSVAKI
jgi:hypothetical protein